MSFDIGPRIGIEGEAEFKKALNNINTDLKTMSTELGKTSAQYEANGKSVKGLTDKQTVLEKTLSVQKSKVDTLKSTLEAAKVKYGESSAQVAKWQQQLNNAEKDVAKTETAIKQTTEQIKDMNGQKFENFQNGMKKVGEVAAGMAKAIGAAALAAGAAFVALAKSSIEGFAEYEQLVGGVETLFGESSSTVQEYANNAYKTAGLSANAYMETVTSFSASLLQSLDGDTAAAASAANQAVIDMSDNANKMGSDISSIQNAYQGFAKQNYTMLDNLKLGYGGTKAEMERLLADAEEFSGIKYDISSLDDVYEAIHVVQTELGITGTTAKEASTTIQGSVSSMKSAWTNFLTGMADPSQNFHTLTDNLVDSVVTVADNIVPVIQRLLPRLADGITKVVNSLITYIPGILQDVIPGIVNGISSMLNGIIAVLPQILLVFSAVIPLLVDAIMTMLPEIIQAGLDVIVSLALGIADALPELIPTVIETMLTIVHTLIENLPTLIEAAIQIIVALAGGLISALPQLVQRIPEIITSLVAALTNPEMLSMLIASAITLIVALAGGLIQAIPELIKSIPQIITSITESLEEGLTAMTDVGLNLVKGLWQGISDAASWLWGMVSGWCNDLVGNIKSFFGIHSPSTVFAEMGGYMAAGLGNGFEDSMQGVAKQMQKSVPTNLEMAGTYSAKAKISTDIVNGISGAMAAVQPIGGTYTINVQLDKKTIAQAIFDPLQNVSKQRGVALA